MPSSDWLIMDKTNQFFTIIESIELADMETRFRFMINIILGSILNIIDLHRA